MTVVSASVERSFNLSGFDSPPRAASVSPERGNTPRQAAGLFIKTFMQTSLELQQILKRFARATTDRLFQFLFDLLFHGIGRGGFCQLAQIR